MYYIRKFQSPVPECLSKDEHLEHNFSGPCRPGPNHPDHKKLYPFTNVGYIGNILVLEIALPGYKQENISVNFIGNCVSVKAKWEERQELIQDDLEVCSAKITYVRRNIKTDDIDRKFYIASEYLGGNVSAKFVNGILTVSVYPPSEPAPGVEISPDDDPIFCNCNCFDESTLATEEDIRNIINSHEWS